MVVGKEDCSLFRGRSKESWKMVEATSTGFQRGLQLQGKYCCQWIAQSLEDPQHADARSCSSTCMRVESRGLQRAAQCFYTLTCGEQWSGWTCGLFFTALCHLRVHAVIRTDNLRVVWAVGSGEPSFFAPNPMTLTGGPRCGQEV